MLVVHLADDVVNLKNDTLDQLVNKAGALICERLKAVLTESTAIELLKEPLYQLHLNNPASAFIGTNMLRHVLHKLSEY